MLGQGAHYHLTGASMRGARALQSLRARAVNGARIGGHMRSNTMLMAASALLVSFACGCAAETAGSDQSDQGSASEPQRNGAIETGVHPQVIGNPPGYNPPGYNPVYPALNPPGYNPPGTGVGVCTPGYNPPGYNPPGYNPPGYNPTAPVANPPGYNPPGYNPPGC
jgi:hypothetical protein